jgi:hypothetical protein
VSLAFDLKVLVPDYVVDGLLFLKRHREGGCIYRELIIVEAFPDDTALGGFLDLTSQPVPLRRRFDDALQILNALTGKTQKTLDLDRARALTARLLAVLIVAALGLWLVTLSPVFSFEGPRFGYTYTAATLLVHALFIPKLISVWWRWGALSRRLDDLAESDHPLVKLIASRGPADAKDDDLDSLKLPAFSPALLFKGPRLTEVRTLCDKYDEAVRAVPQLLDTLGHTLGCTDDLRLLDGLGTALQERWRASVGVAAPQLAELNPLLFFAYVDHRAFDDLFTRTVKAANVATPSSLGSFGAVGFGLASGALAPLLVDQHPEVSARWRAELRDRMPAGLDAALIMWWVALQPEAEDIRGLVARAPILPLLVREQLKTTS